ARPGAGHPRLPSLPKQDVDGRDIRAFTPVFDGLCPAMTLLSDRLSECMPARRKQKGAATRRPFDCPARLPGSMAGGVHSARDPHIDAGEQEQPYHVDEMPVPGAELKAEMLRGREVSEIGADEAHDQEGRTDDDMGAV